MSKQVHALLSFTGLSDFQLVPLSELLRVPALKAPTLTLPKVGIGLKSMSLSSISTKIVSLSNPIQGSDLLFLGLGINQLRFVAVTVFNHLTVYPKWFTLAFDVYTSVIVIAGLIVYFARRYQATQKKAE